MDVSPDVESSAPRGSGRLGPALATLAAVLALLALVAVAAGGDTPTGSGDTRRPSHLLIDTLVSLYIVLMAFGAVVFVYLMLLRKDSAYERARLRRESRFRGVLLFGVFLGLIALFLRIAEERRDDGTLRPPDPATTATQPGAPSPEEGYEPEFAALPVAIVLGLVAIAAVALFLAARARKKALGPLRDPRLLEALEDVLGESLDDLRAERDPRKAVIAAYARLERTLAAYGLPRAAAEAPAEYLARMLTELEVSHESAGRLTALFERAKFSQHEVDATMKEEAIDALETARRELADARERELAERAAALAEARTRAARDVRRSVIRAVEAVAVPTIALVVVAAVAPGHLGLAAYVYGLVVAAIALLAVLAALNRAYPPPGRSLVDEALERPEREEERLSELARLEREVTLGVASTYDLHFRLRPTLRETAAGLLAVRRGIDLDRQPERARAALGDETWQLVRADLEPPADRLARGIDPERLRRAIEALEAV